MRLNGEFRIFSCSGLFSRYLVAREYTKPSLTDCSYGFWLPVGVQSFIYLSIMYFVPNAFFLFLLQVSSKDEDFLDLSVDVEQNTSITHCLR